MWAVFRATLATDDSFTFNKAVKQLRTLIEALPVAEENEDTVLATALAGPGPNDSPVLLAAALHNTAAYAYDVESNATAWDEGQAQAARRQALLDCMLAAKAQCVNVRTLVPLNCLVLLCCWSGFLSHNTTA